MFMSSCEESLSRQSSLMSSATRSSASTLGLLALSKARASGDGTSSKSPTGDVVSLALLRCYLHARALNVLHGSFGVCGIQPFGDLDRQSKGWLCALRLANAANKSLRNWLGKKPIRVLESSCTDTRIRAQRIRTLRLTDSRTGGFAGPG